MLSYGFTHVVSPADIITAYPEIMPFASKSNYKSFARPLARPVQDSHTPPPDPLKIDAIFVFNDPRDWALDIQIIIDLLLSRGGILGTISPLNGDSSFPNHGYQQDGQPDIYFSNPDLFWAAKYHLPRLGQGGFREALEGVWKHVTNSAGKDVILHKKMFGKPFQGTFEFAEKRLENHRKDLFTKEFHGSLEGLRRVYMVGGKQTEKPILQHSLASPKKIQPHHSLPTSLFPFTSFPSSHLMRGIHLLIVQADNPESDILGANSYTGLSNGRDNASIWHSILVRTGVYGGGEPKHQPSVVVNDVWDAVLWGVGRERLFEVD